jgi:hypothetical protein
MRRIVAAVALAASSVLLAGCMPESTFPESMTPAEVRELIAEQDAMWWEAIAPGEPQPEVDPIEYVRPGEESTLVMDCVIDAGIPGVTATSDGYYTYEGDDEDMGALNRQQYICQQLYPYDPGDPPALGYFTPEQIAWLNNYVKTRLVPCLQLAGFTIGTPAYSIQYVWTPYFELHPMPQGSAQWDRVDLMCPPPPYGAMYRPFDDRD